MAYEQGSGPQDSARSQARPDGRAQDGRPSPYGRPDVSGHPSPPPPRKPELGVVIGVIAVVVMVLVGIGVVISRLSAGEGTPVAGRAAPSVVVVDPEWDDLSNTGKTLWQDRFRDAQQARVGDTLTLAKDDWRLTVTVTGYFDPATPRHRSPQPGARWVAVGLRVEQQGTRDLYCCDAGWARLVDQYGVEYVPRDSHNSRIAEGGNMSAVGTYPLVPGATSSGVLVFELPDRVKAEKLLFGRYSGGPASKAVWRLN
ncbi:hypothetical protein [Thermobispora bispora]|uniref:DUF4352 domain-containing protein n=1 Tax=Thermobispora bispora (strain ATCC 19993 / DSM 43833 / CBS 139.67 / JCM 10125 / KCTC 9307 / NBRC 14880 / R51) TaxID=469371 RepID=D6Y1M4_THEBD|nr:hypothetical protein [Thermobispora bispora]ADG88630.1 hypothetical protein Tbis_1918 [Thermobispora bispora DSM 43833]MBO2475739.1 hypothetical protein [Actinomycetales bacterium]QSI48416.1 hypothetical protein CYL17_11555 [Thermobispora bispora]